MRVSTDKIIVEFSQEEASVIAYLLENILEEDPLGTVADILEMGIDRVALIYGALHIELKKRLDIYRDSEV